MKRPTDHVDFNRELADLFHRMAGCYRYLGPGQRFRAIAYDNASRSIQGLKDDVSTLATDKKALDSINGIGESIAEKIIEYLSSGKVMVYEKLKKKVPEGVLELMDIAGFGPATAKLLYKKFGISNREQLVDALEKDKLTGLKGFGPKKIENLTRSLKLFKQGQKRMLLSEALQTGNELLFAIKGVPGVQHAELAGSLRRRKETIGDIDIVVCAARKDWKGIINETLKLPQLKRTLAKGETKLSFLLRRNNVQVDIRMVAEDVYGAALLYFTGSKEHNISLRTRAKANGWKVNEYGVFDAKTNKKLAGRTEEEIYSLFDMQYVAPELRENKGEIEAARQFALPALVGIKDIRGDMQMHSRWSDGAYTIEQIAGFVSRELPHYEYIVMTDHSRSQRVAGGLEPEDFRKQFREIEKVNAALGRDLVKKGVEVDILSDGKLDLPDGLLSRFDWVTASIHSGFSRDNTSRLIAACRHPFVHCIGHPGGRLIGKRDPYPVDWEALFRVLAETGTAIEVNAQPDRLDLKDDLIRAAVQAGVAITISTDAHALSQYEYMELGVATAKRGWCTKRAVLNTRSWKEIEKFKQHKAGLIRKDTKVSAVRKTAGLA